MSDKTTQVVPVVPLEDGRDDITVLRNRIEELEATNRANTERYGSIINELQRKLAASQNDMERKSNPSWIAQHATEAAYEMDGLYDRIEELEAAHAEADKQFHQIADQRDELKRKYDALVGGINSAQSHTAEALRLLQWDQLGWDVPEEVIESLGKVDSQLRALLEDE